MRSDAAGNSSWAGERRCRKADASRGVVSVAWGSRRTAARDRLLARTHGVTAHRAAGPRGRAAGPVDDRCAVCHLALAAEKSRRLSTRPARLPIHYSNPRDFPGECRQALVGHRCPEPPVCRHIRGQSAPHVLIAMQKVVGSNPISRSPRQPAPRAGFRLSGGRPAWAVPALFGSNLEALAPILHPTRGVRSPLLRPCAASVAGPGGPVGPGERFEIAGDRLADHR
jgi:hypothetical protein